VKLSAAPWFRLATLAALAAAAPASSAGPEPAAEKTWRSFEPLRRPEVPAEASDPSWAGNPLDAFISRAHRERGLVPRPEAPRHVLLRRLYLDLTGLPPGREELRRFLDDDSPGAFEKVADRLLSSPRYGERWARHWMDVWRYSDWAGWGEQVRDSQPHVWRWRDWIVESLNADKGYDRMVVEMLAGDELAPEDPDALRATGFLVRNFKLLSREQWMQETIDHTTKAFLGVTLECARCHDHRYDPISQEDYYRVRAVFEPYQVRIDRLPGEPDTKKQGLARVYDADPDAKTFLYERGDDRKPLKDRPLSPAVPAALGGLEFRPVPVSLPLAARVPDKRPFVIEETLAASRQALEAARKALEEVKARAQARPEDRELAELEAELAAARHGSLEATIRAERLEDEGAASNEAALAAAAAQRQLALVEARRNLLAARLDVDKARAGAGDKAAEILSAAQKKLAQSEEELAATERERALPLTAQYAKRQLTTYPASSSGRRLAFARWITDRANPLAARVAANHIWARHFGRSLVASVFDFGRNGQEPSHPELLDWLAAELMGLPHDSGEWSMKRIHRLIVTSAAYRMDSTVDPEDVRIDPDDVFLWRWSPRRLEAEAVRDCILHVTGRLDAKLGGPDIDHTKGLAVPRRSLYFRHAAEKQMEFLKLFDAAAVTECYRRKESNVPQQALALANSELTLAGARALARALANESANDVAFVRAAYEHVLSREPTAPEIETCSGFLAAQERFFVENRERLDPTAAEPSDASRPSADPALRARENLVHTLLNHHELVTIR
jgi:hypothetical protein